MVRVFYEMDGVEYSEVLGWSELDTKAEGWGGVYRVEVLGFGLAGRWVEVFRWVLGCTTWKKSKVSKEQFNNNSK